MYNVACGYSLKGEIEPGCDWFGKAVDAGFGMRDGNVEHTEGDSDLDNLRQDPRFIAHFARMKERKEAAEAWAAEPEVYIPEELKPAEGEEPRELPLLVVLHDQGSGKKEVVSGVWKELADELGFVLIAPSGRFPTAGAPEDGMAWFMSEADYAQQYWVYERPATEAVVAFRKQYKPDRQRVFIAGEGQGAQVAFNIAVRAPGLYKGLLTLNGSPIPQLVADRAPNAGKRGLKVEMRFERSVFADFAEMMGADAETVETESIKQFTAVLDQWTIAGSVSVFDGDRKAALRSAIEALAPPEPEPESEPVDGGDGG